VAEADEAAVGQRDQSLEGHRRPAPRQIGAWARWRGGVSGRPPDARAPDAGGDGGLAGAAELAQGRPAPVGDRGQLVAARVGHLDDEAVDHGGAGSGVHVEVHDVGATGSQVAGERREVARCVGQLHPELVSSHAPSVPRRSSCCCHDAGERLPAPQHCATAARTSSFVYLT
jgi:hypothetical protein